MQDPCLADFYHGWIIEVVQVEDGFKSTCYSPSRRRFSDYTSHPSDFQALSAAKKTINQHLACQLLGGFLRDMYELKKLNFEEWRSLNESLNKAIATS